MFTAVVIRVSADIFKYPTAIKENVKPDRRQWRNYTSRGFHSHAGYLKKKLPQHCGSLMLATKPRSVDLQEIRGEYLFLNFFSVLPFNSKYLRVF